jgi:hypothetical protein
VIVVRSAESVLAVTRLPSERSARPVTPPIGLGLLELRVRGSDRGLGLVQRGERLVGLALADRLLGGERLEALHLDLRELAARLLLLQRGARLVDREHVRRRIDDEEHLAGGDGGAFVVQALLEDAGHARADLDLARALGLADRLERDGKALRGDADRAHGKRRGRGAGGGRLVLAAGGQREGGGRDQDAKQAGGLHGIAYYTYLPEGI